MANVFTPAMVAKTIDHALLRPELTPAEVIAGCKIASEYGVFSVCVKPCHITLARAELDGSSVLVGTVIGFPHGGSTLDSKRFEASDAIEKGAAELDMVINIAALKAGYDDVICHEIEGVVRATNGAIVKVILETSYLSDEEIKSACHIAEGAGAAFVKTSTGFSSQGATAEHVRLMRASVGAKVQVKASGGIRNWSDAVEMLEAGATRLGTTGTVAILTGGVSVASY